MKRQGRPLRVARLGFAVVLPGLLALAGCGCLALVAACQFSGAPRAGEQPDVGGQG